MQKQKSKLTNKQKSTPRHTIFKLQKIKGKEKFFERNQREKITFPLERQRYELHLISLKNHVGKKTM